MVGTWGFPILTTKVLECERWKKKISFPESAHLAGVAEGVGELNPKPYRPQALSVPWSRF